MFNSKLERALLTVVIGLSLLFLVLVPSKANEGISSAQEAERPFQTESPSTLEQVMQSARAQAAIQEQLVSGDEIPMNSGHEIPSATEPLIAQIRFRHEPLLGEFDVQAFLEAKGSGLASVRVRYVASGDNVPISEVIATTAISHGIAPQVLLALLEIQSGLISDASPTLEQIESPLKLPSQVASGFIPQLEWTARYLDTMAPRFDLDHSRARTEALLLADGSEVELETDRTPTTALIRFIAISANRSEYDSFQIEFGNLYQDFFQVDPLDFPASLAADLSDARLPFEGSQRYTGGPHGGGTTTPCAQIAIADGSAIDFSKNYRTTDADWEVLSILPGTLVWKDETDDNYKGISVRIKHSDQLASEYWHLDRLSDEIGWIQEGSQITRGFPIGYVGRTGSQTSDHLHLELRTPLGGDNPIPWHGTTIDGYTIGLHKVFSNQGYGYNYQGSAVKGSTKNAQLTAYCGGTGANYALVGANYDKTSEQNGADSSTIFADASGPGSSSAGRLISDNSYYAGYMPSDINKDGAVNVLDYAILFENFGRCCEGPGNIPGDINADGDVDIYDYIILFNTFGMKAGTRPSAAADLIDGQLSVPEPASDVSFSSEVNPIGTNVAVSVNWTDNSENEDGFEITWTVEDLGTVTYTKYDEEPPPPPDTPDVAATLAITRSTTLVQLPCAELGGTTTITATVIAFNAEGGSAPAEGSGSIDLPTCPVLGDANGDGKVGPNDFSVWAYYFHPFNIIYGGPSVGDFNYDHRVNGIDFSIWAYYFEPF